MKVTIKEIAKEAGVSIGTVSRVVNQKDEGVGQETRKRVLDVIARLNYQPNTLARALITNQSKIIGLILPDISNPFFPLLTRGIEDCARDAGYRIFLCNTDDDTAKEREYIRVLKEHRVDGIIFTSTVMATPSEYLELRDLNIPVVVMDRRITDKSADDEHGASGVDGGIEGVNGVFVDNIGGAYAATQHLIALGHRKIGCITGPLSSRNACDRLEGYEQALRDAGIAPSPEWICQGDYKPAKGYEAAGRLIDKGIRAIFASNDLMAFGVYRAASERGLSIPEDLSVVGFDGILQSEFMMPPLTTVIQPTYEVGRAAMTLLRRAMANQAASGESVELFAELAVRGSTAPLRPGP